VEEVAVFLNTEEEKREILLLALVVHQVMEHQVEAEALSVVVTELLREDLIL